MQFKNIVVAVFAAVAAVEAIAVPDVAFEGAEIIAREEAVPAVPAAPLEPQIVANKPGWPKCKFRILPPGVARR